MDDKVLLLFDDEVVSDEGDVLVVTKTREGNKEVIVISDSESGATTYVRTPESAPVSLLNRKVKRVASSPLCQSS